jgi:hypothetical protein
MLARHTARVRVAASPLVAIITIIRIIAIAVSAGVLLVRVVESAVIDVSAAVAEYPTLGAAMSHRCSPFVSQR